MPILGILLPISAHCLQLQLPNARAVRGDDLNAVHAGQTDGSCWSILSREDVTESSNVVALGQPEFWGEQTRQALRHPSPPLEKTVSLFPPCSQASTAGRMRWGHSAGLPPFTLTPLASCYALSVPVQRANNVASADEVHGSSAVIHAAFHAAKMVASVLIFLAAVHEDLQELPPHEPPCLCPSHPR
eukprot:3460609-Rhodomonas_salina.1